MAIIETLVIPVACYPQPLIQVTLDDGGTGQISASTIRYTDHTGVVVSVPLSMANCRKLFSALAIDGSPIQKNKFT